MNLAILHDDFRERPSLSDGGLSEHGNNAASASAVTSLSATLA